jgi:hypothetical protein
MSAHVKILAVLYIVFGVLGICVALFAGLALGVFASIIGASGEHNAPLGMAVLGLTGITLALVLLILSVPGIICGWGLLKFRPWARILGIILAAIGLIRFPIGTLFGIYALWVLFQKDTEQLFAPAQPLPPA